MAIFNGKKITLSVEAPTSDIEYASDVIYDNTQSGMEATNVQDAIDELKSAAASASDVAYDNTESGLDATDVQAAVDEINEKKAEKDGYYEGMTVGNANQALSSKALNPISPDSGTTQDAPFISQGTGTANNTASVDVSPVAKQLEKQGYTVVNNQLVGAITPESENDLTITFVNGVLTVSGTASANTNIKLVDGGNIINDHKYLVLGVPAGGSNSTYGGYFSTSGRYVLSDSIVTASTDGSYNIRVTSGITVNISCVPKLIDLTQYFNGNDNIPQDLLDHPDHWFWYYNGTGAYNAGTLVNASGRYLVCTKRNIYKPAEAYTIVVPNRVYNYKGGSTTTITYYDRDKNTIGTESVANGSQFTTPANCVYIASSVTSGVTISLYYTAEQGGEGYDSDYPYQEPNVYDTGTEELLAYDTKDTDSTVHHNTSSVDLGSLTWVKYTASGAYQTFFYTNASSVLPNCKANGDTNVAPTNIICDSYLPVSRDTVYYTSGAIGIDVESTGYVYIADPSANSKTAEEFKTYMSGKYLQYELATPTTEQGTSFAKNIDIDDYGMMYWLDTNNALVGTPQGCEIQYPPAYVESIDTFLGYTNGDVTNTVLKGALASGDPDTLKGVLNHIDEKVPDAPTTDGTYTLKVTIADGTATYSWEAQS